MPKATFALSGKRRSRALLIIPGFVLASAAYWVVFRCPLPFVPSWWNVDAEHGTALQTRYRIADHMASSGQLQGMTRAEVIALLGKPTDTDKFKERRLIYVLGPERGFIRIDYEWLALDFNSSGRVSNVAVVSD